MTRSTALTSAAMVRGRRDPDRRKARRQIGDLKQPKIMVEGHGVKQDKRRAGSHFLVIDVETVRSADRHELGAPAVGEA